MKKKILTVSICLAISQGALAAQGDTYIGGAHDVIFINGNNNDNTLNPTVFSNGSVNNLNTYNQAYTSLYDMTVDLAEIYGGSTLNTENSSLNNLIVSNSTVNASGNNSIYSLSLGNSTFNAINPVTIDNFNLSGYSHVFGNTITTKTLWADNYFGMLGNIQTDPTESSTHHMNMSGDVFLNNSTIHNTMDVSSNLGLYLLDLNNTSVDGLTLTNSGVQLNNSHVDHLHSFSGNTHVDAYGNSTIGTFQANSPASLNLHDNASISSILSNSGDSISMFDTSSILGGHIVDASINGFGGTINDTNITGGQAQFLPGSTFNLNNVHFNSTNIANSGSLQITNLYVNDGIAQLGNIGGANLYLAQNVSASVDAVNLDTINIDGSSLQLNSIGTIRNLVMSNGATVLGYDNLMTGTNVTLNNSRAYNLHYDSLDNVEATNASVLNLSSQINNLNVQQNSVASLTNSDIQVGGIINSSAILNDSSAGLLNVADANLSVTNGVLGTVLGTVSEATFAGNVRTNNMTLVGGNTVLRDSSATNIADFTNANVAAINNSSVLTYSQNGGNLLLNDNAYFSYANVQNANVIFNGGGYNTFNATNSSVTANVSMNTGTINLTGGDLMLNNDSRLANLTTVGTNIRYGGNNTTTLGNVNATGGSFGFLDETVGQSFLFDNVQTNGTALNMRIDLDNNLSDIYTVNGQFSGSAVFNVNLSGTGTGADNILLMSTLNDADRTNETVQLQGANITDLSQNINTFAMLNGAYAVTNSPYIWNLNGLNNGWYLQSSAAFTPTTTSHVTLPLVTAYQTMPSVMDHVNTRLRQSSDVGVWGQYVQDQSTLSSFNGLESNTRLSGFDVGHDVMVKNVRVGFGLSYRDQETKHNQDSNLGYVASTKASGSTWAAQMYADKNVGAYHIIGQVAVARNSHDNTYNSGVVHSKGDAYSAQFSVDRSTSWNGFNLKPSVGVRYTKADESMAFEDTSLLASVDISKSFNNDVTLTVTPTLATSIARDKSMEIVGLGSSDINVDRTRFGLNVQLDKTIGNKTFYVKAGSKSLGQGNQWDVSLGGSLKF